MAEFHRILLDGSVFEIERLEKEMAEKMQALHKCTDKAGVDRVGAEVRRLAVNLESVHLTRATAATWLETEARQAAEAQGA